jgi:hypothetical protein
MKNNKKKSRIQLFVLEKKANNNGMLNPISYCFYVLPSVYIPVEKNLQLFMGKKRRKSHGRRSSSHPIP